MSNLRRRQTDLAMSSVSRLIKQTANNESIPFSLNLKQTREQKLLIWRQFTNMTSRLRRKSLEERLDRLTKNLWTRKMKQRKLIIYWKLKRNEIGS